MTTTGRCRVRPLSHTSASPPRPIFWLNIGLNHLVNWALLSGALGAALLRTRLTPLVLFSLVTGFGAATAILWEIGEYFAFIRGGTELATAYTDTLGDEVLGLSGAALGGLTVSLVARRRSSRRAATAVDPGFELESP